MFEKGPSSRNFADGMLFQISDVFERILVYNHWTQLSEITTISAAAIVVVVNLGAFLNSRPLVWLAAGPCFVLFLGFILLGVLVFVVGIMVLILGLTETSGYRPDMAMLYGIWLAVLWGLPLIAAFGLLSSEKLYGADLTW
jgi:hypothetical protein